MHIKLEERKIINSKQKWHTRSVHKYTVQLLLLAASITRERRGGEFLIYANEARLGQRFISILWHFTVEKRWLKRFKSSQHHFQRWNLTFSSLNAFQYFSLHILDMTHHYTRHGIAQIRWKVSVGNFPLSPHHFRLLQHTRFVRLEGSGTFTFSYRIIRPKHEPFTSATVGQLGKTLVRKMQNWVSSLTRLCWHCWCKGGSNAMRGKPRVKTKNIHFPPAPVMRTWCRLSLFDFEYTHATIRQHKTNGFPL